MPAFSKFIVFAACCTLCTAHNYTTVRGAVPGATYALGYIRPVNPPRPTLNQSSVPIQPMAAALPLAFDWRTTAAVPVRSQFTCGACWAFATMGTLEFNIKIKTGQTVDLSEQQLVSCDRNAGGCGGGWVGYPYLMNNPPKLESTYPYSVGSCCPTPDTCCARSTYPCNTGGSASSYRVTGWGYVDSRNTAGSYGIIPTDAAIKAAIMTNGPVMVAVWVGNSFVQYSSGVFATHEANPVAGGQTTNHAVVLVGWDDSKSAWIMRNSWGTSWGMSGYMYIKYGTSRIGEDAAFAAVSTTTPAPSPAPAPRPAVGCIVQRGMDQAGGFTLMAALTGSQSDADCNARCGYTTGCRYWVRQPTTGNCWLSSTVPTAMTAASDRNAGPYCPGCSVATSTDQAAGFTQIAALTGSVSDSDCNAKCRSTTGCVYWVRQPTTGNCWLSSTWPTSLKAAVDRNAGPLCPGCLSYTNYDQNGGFTSIASLFGSTTNADCNAKCGKTSGCVYWIRQPTTGACWLSSTWPTALKVAADRNLGPFCPGGAVAASEHRMLAAEDESSQPVIASQPSLVSQLADFGSRFWPVPCVLAAAVVAIIKVGARRSTTETTEACSSEISDITMVL